MTHSPGTAQLFVLAGVDRARSFVLGERTVLGRSSECDVVLHDRSISRKHALLVCQESRWFLRDLGSTNGIHRGGERVESLELRDGDEFQLGDLPLRLRLTVEPLRDDDIEFASPLEIAPPVTSATRVPPAAPGRSRGARPAEDDEIEIEMDAGDPVPATAGPTPATAGSTKVGPGPGVAPREARRNGLLSGDLGQYPTWVRALLLLLLLALASGVFAGAYLAMRGLRAGP